MRVSQERFLNVLYRVDSEFMDDLTSTRILIFTERQILWFHNLFFSISRKMQ